MEKRPGPAGGAFHTLDNGEEAFAYGFTSLCQGSRGLCTVRRQAREELKKLINIEGVVDYEPAIA